MKKIFIAILLLISSVAQAEETFCAPTRAGGSVHLLAEGKAIILSGTGVFVLGSWEILGDTQVFVRWEDGDSSIYPVNYFKRCQL